MATTTDRVEIITLVQRRRRWTAAEKMRLSEQTFALGLHELSTNAVKHGGPLPAGGLAAGPVGSGRWRGKGAPTVSSFASPSVPAFDSAERRQVTVMFSDLVGSTALSAQMDPEDLREVISIYQKAVAETARRFGGFVAKYMGDGVLIYFGYPRAHEDDAEQAVLAGLELIATVSKLKTHARLHTRVGIATGIVVAGDLIGSGEAQERGIVGETPNLAARLQGFAKPDMVVIAEGTRRLVGNLFEFAPLDAMDLKGIAGPVKSWAALRRASIESRFEALLASGLAPLVGREEEIDALLRRWVAIKAGDGQVVHISGEAGIGKSRLAAALLERVADSRTRGCVISAHRITQTVHSVRSSSK